MKFAGESALPTGKSSALRKAGGCSPSKRLDKSMDSTKPDRGELESLIKSQLPAITKTAIRLTGCVHRAEELVQETVLRALRGWKSFRGHSQFKTWVYRILINVYRDQTHKQRGRKGERLLAEPMDKRPSVERQMATRELAEIAAELIRQLPVRQREVLILSTYEAMTTNEISEALSISPANVYSTLSLARKKLKQDLSRYLSHKKQP